jgi:hypothetical protein
MPYYFRFCFAGVLSAALLANLAGCNEDSSSASTGGAASAGAGGAPVISGDPATAATTGETYNFQPTVTAPAGAALSFSIANQPSWAKFDRGTGMLTGSPTTNDAGNFADIVITVEDEAGTTALAPFSIRVTSGSAEVATITWTATQGGTEQELTGYRVYYGTSAAGMTHVVTVADPSETSYVVENLSPGTWFFAIASYDRNNIQSTLSPTVSVML